MERIDSNLILNNVYSGGVINTRIDTNAILNAVYSEEDSALKVNVIGLTGSGETYWELDGQPVETYASYTGVEGLTTPVYITADVAGEAGNDIEITGAYSLTPFSYTGTPVSCATPIMIAASAPQTAPFNVSIVKNVTLAISIGAHNAANPTKIVTVISGDDTQVPTQSSAVTLDGEGKQIGMLVVEWNNTNPSNTATLTGDPLQILTIGTTLTLSGGEAGATEIKPLDGYVVNYKYIKNNIIAKTENYQVQDGDYIIIVGVGADTILIPSFLCDDGRTIIIKSLDAETLPVTILTEGMMIDGSLTPFIITENNNAYTFVALNNNWYII